MYYVITTQEVAKGFSYATLTNNKDFCPSCGFKEVGRSEFIEQKRAVQELLKLRKIYCKNNLQLDPTYLPPSRRAL